MKTHKADVAAMKAKDVAEWQAKNPNRSADDHFWWYAPSYEGIVADFGAEVVDKEELGSYQGDLLFLLRDGDRWGFLVVGYGSCSGCDALQACDENVGEIQKLADELLNSIRWCESAEEMDRLLAQRDQANDYWFDEGGREAVARFRSKLGIPADRHPEEERTA